MQITILSLFHYDMFPFSTGAVEHPVYLMNPKTHIDRCHSSFTYSHCSPAFQSGKSRYCQALPGSFPYAFVLSANNVALSRPVSMLPAFVVAWKRSIQNAARKTCCRPRMLPTLLPARFAYVEKDCAAMLAAFRLPATPPNHPYAVHLPPFLKCIPLLY